MPQPAIGTLELTILGPLIYELGYGEDEGRVYVYAPWCDNHAAGVSTVLKESPLPGVGEEISTTASTKGVKRNEIGKASSSERLYKLDGIQGKPRCRASEKILRAIVKAPDPSECYFWLDLPKPDAMLGINTVNAAIKKEGVVGADVDLATGMRLYYTGVDLANPPSLYKDGVNFYTPAFDHDFKGYPHGDMMIRFEGPVRDDFLHRDATSCFRHLTELLGLKWQFVPNPKSLLLRITGGDCHSPNLLLASD
jgi:hypothetical protein